MPSLQLPVVIEPYNSAFGISSTMVGAILHIQIDASRQDAGHISRLQSLIDVLQLYSVPFVLVGECATAGDVATAMQLQPFTDKHETTHLITTQHSQAYISLRAAITRLRLPIKNLIFTSVSPSLSLHEAATFLGLSSSHFAPDSLSSWTTEVLQRVATITNKAGALRVGYLMKPEREVTLQRHGLLSLLPVDGVCFLPLDIHRPLQQQAPVDMVLHKLTDFLTPTEGSGEPPSFLPKAEGLLKSAQKQGLCIVDALPSIATVVDRVLMAQALEAACVTVRKQAVPAGTPPWILVDTFGPEVVRSMQAAGLDLPCIIKPRVACGVGEAHQMAFVLHPDGFTDLEVPLPAIVQGYSDHGGVVWKVYVMGNKIFIAQKKSTPDLSSLSFALSKDPEADIPTSIHFDSLRSLPVLLPRSLQSHQHQDNQAATKARAESLLRSQYLETLAAALRHQLGLTLFGFDVVFDGVAGEVRVVDVNYFPSYRGVEEGGEAFRETLKEVYAKYVLPCNNVYVAK